MIIVNNKKQELNRIVTETAEETLKYAATARNDTGMNMVITNNDLIAKVFKKHEKCFCEYTRAIKENTEVCSSSERSLLEITMLYYPSLVTK